MALGLGPSGASESWFCVELPFPDSAPCQSSEALGVASEHVRTGSSGSQQAAVVSSLLGSARTFPAEILDWRKDF